MASRIKDARGSKYDRASRVAHLSADQVDGPAMLTGTPFTVGATIELPIEQIKVSTVNGVRTKRVVNERRDHRSHNCCEFCGMKVSMLPADREEWTIRGEEDRIIPGTQGGRYKLDNLQIACRVCNASRGDKSVGQFVADNGKWWD